MAIAIDIIFIIMAAYGFYFGYVYGLIKVVMFLVSLLIALGISMYVTPATAQLIQETLDVESALLPFVAFVITLVGIMLVARIVFKLMEENVNSKRLNQFTQVIGGGLMATIFIFLYSVLVTFFSAAHVIQPQKVKEDSFFYTFVEHVPDYGTTILTRLAPYMEHFVVYMQEAFNRLETGQSEEKDNNFDDYFSADDIKLDDSTLIAPEIDTSSKTNFDSLNNKDELDTVNVPEIVIQQEE